MADIVRIPNKGMSMIAKKFVEKNTVVVFEKPCYYRQKGGGMDMLFRDILQDVNHCVVLKSLFPRDIEELPNHLRDKFKDEINKYADKQLIKKFRPEHILSIYAKMRLNAFNIENYPGILIISSNFNHSCDPNLEIVTKKGKMIFRAIRPINQGEELTISYIEPYDDKERRIDTLFNNYGFICNCPKCETQS